MMIIFDSLECSVWMHSEPEEIEYSDLSGTSEEVEYESERIPEHILSEIDFDWRSDN